MPAVAISAQEKLVLAAERLFAERGPDVSLRDIGAAAGNGNNSAVQYHFGSKERLVRAIFEYRMPRIHDRRAMLIAERQPDDLRSWLDCEVRAILEQSELEGSHYLGFTSMLRQHGRRDAFENRPQEYLDTTRELHDRLSGFLAHIPEPLRVHRISQAMGMVSSAGADRERARARGDALLSFPVQVGDLIDATVGFLEASVSPRTLELLEAGPTDVGWLRLL